MVKRDAIRLEAKVLDALPNAVFKAIEPLEMVGTFSTALSPIRITVPFP